jgi:hypothetical protein
MTPPGYTVVAGRAACPVCSRPFEVSRRAAKLANGRAAFFAMRMLINSLPRAGGHDGS